MIAVRALFKLMHGPYADHEETGLLRLAKLKSLLTHAKELTPFYARILAGIDVAGFATIGDVRRLPIVKPAQIRAQPTDDLTAANLDRSKLVRDGTSGSSGAPFKFYLSQEEFTLRQLRLLRCLYHHGLKPWWRWVSFYPELETKRSSPFQRLVASRIHRLPVGLPLDEQIRGVLAIKPQLIQGLTSTIDLLATRMLERNIACRRTKLILTGGEVFPPGLTEKVRAVFGCRVVDQYGGNEVGPVGYTCPHCDLCYFDDDSQIVEILDENDDPVGPGERGRVVMTVLDQRTTPIIRLDIGDYITQPRSVTHCKNRFTHYVSVDGRESDRITLPDGRVLLVQQVIAAGLNANGIRRLQVVQKAAGDILCRYSMAPGSSREQIERSIRESLGFAAAAPLLFELCDDIPAEPGGKFRMIKKER